MRSTWDITARVLMAYFILLATFFVLVVAVAAIPLSAIHGNLESSVQTIAQEGEYPAHGPSLTMQDNFTDCVMLNIAAGSDAGHPVVSAMSNTLHMDNGDIIGGTLDLLNGQQVESRLYARYWHGSQVLLRPLLCVMDYRGIRIFNYVFLGLLALACILLGYRQVSRTFAAVFAVGLLFVTGWLVPINMQYVACFAVMLAAMLVILLMPNRYRSTRAVCLLFFVIGGVTQFFDLLTTPIITLGLPLIVWCLIHKPAHAARMVVVLSLMWLLGYATLWASKWVIAGLITGSDVIGDAVQSAQVRTAGGEMAEQGLTAMAIYKMYWSSLVSTRALIAEGAFIIVAVILYRYFGRPRRFISANLWLLLVAAMPVVWTLVLAQHTFLHHFFTWRIVLVTVVALLLFVCHTISFRKRI